MNPITGRTMLQRGSMLGAFLALDKLVEAVSGQSLEVYFRANIFALLGMKDSGFLIDSLQKRRVATFHSRRADGGLEPASFEMPQRPEFFMGGGAFSTPRDLWPSCGRC